MNLKSSLILATALLALTSACTPKPSVPATTQTVTAQPIVQIPTAAPTVTTESASTVDTSTWQTYQNNEYGFTFKAPTELAIQYVPVPAKSERKDTAPLYSGVSDKGTFSLEVWQGQVLDPDNVQGPYGKIDKPQVVTVGTKQGYLYNEGDAGCGGPTIQVPLVHDILVIGFYDCGGEKEDLGGNTARMNQILSTFTFTGSATSDSDTALQTYTDRSGSFSFQYPATWEVCENKTGQKSYHGDTILIQDYSGPCPDWSPPSPDNTLYGVFPKFTQLTTPQYYYVTARSRKDMNCTDYKSCISSFNYKDGGNISDVKKEFTVGGYPAVCYVYSSEIGDGGSQIEIFSDTNRVAFDLDNSDTTCADLQDIFSILSTFKFTK